MKWIISIGRGWAISTKITTIFHLPLKRIWVSYTKICGAQNPKMKRNLKLSHALSTQTVLNCHHIYGFSKVFAGNLTHKFVYFWMLEQNPLRKGYWNWLKPLRIRMWEESLASCLSMLISNLNKEMLKNKRIVLKTFFFLSRRHNNFNMWFLTSSIRIFKVL